VCNRRERGGRQKLYDFVVVIVVVVVVVLLFLLFSIAIEFSVFLYYIRVGFSMRAIQSSYLTFDFMLRIKNLILAFFIRKEMSSSISSWKKTDNYCYFIIILVWKRLIYTNQSFVKLETELMIVVEDAWSVVYDFNKLSLLK
jgi:hypothetical protein